MREYARFLSLCFIFVILSSRSNLNTIYQCIFFHSENPERKREREAVEEKIPSGILVTRIIYYSFCPFDYCYYYEYCHFEDINEVQEHIIEILIRLFIFGFLSFTLSFSIRCKRDLRNGIFVNVNRWEDNFVIWTHADFFCCTIYGVCTPFRRFCFAVKSMYRCVIKKCPAMYQQNLLSKLRRGITKFGAHTQKTYARRNGNAEWS